MISLPYSGFRMLTRAAVLGVLLLTFTACGGSSSKVKPTARPTAAASRPLPIDRQAVNTALTFLRAFKRGDRLKEIGLESASLHRRNLHEFVAQMLGVQSAPRRVDLVSARTFKTPHGRWTRVVARLRYPRRTVLEALGVVKTRSGYRVNSIQHLRSSRS